jgi:hypothetical protein
LCIAWQRIQYYRIKSYDNVDYNNNVVVVSYYDVRYFENHMIKTIYASNYVILFNNNGKKSVFKKRIVVCWKLESKKKIAKGQYWEVFTSTYISYTTYNK